MRKITYWLFISSILIIAACKKDSGSKWDTEVLIPLASTSLSLENIVKDTSIIKKQSDNSFLLTYRKEVYSFSLANQLINLPDTFIGTTFRLDSLALPNQRIFYKTSLGQMAKQLQASPDPTSQIYGNFIAGSHNQMRVIPAINGLSTPPTVFDASLLFDYAKLKSGQLYLVIRNFYPIPISSAVIEIKDNNSGNVILSETLPYIAAKDSALKVVDISGKSISNSLSFELKDLNSPGSNGQQVFVDTSDYLEADIFLNALRIEEATAIFPQQDVVSLTEEVTQQLGERRLTYIDCRRGKLKIFVTSTVPEQLYLEYTLEGAFDKFGRPLVESTIVPPAPPGGSATIDKEFNLAGYSIDLSGKNGNKFNTYTQTIKARIDSSGIKRTLTLKDSLIIRYDIKDVAPNYIKGYAGRDTFIANDSTDFDIFSNLFQSGTIQLKDVDLKLTLENGMGVDGVVKINDFTATSLANGSRTLTGAVLANPINVGRAKDLPLRPTITNININKSNSNITDVIGILPNKIRYNFEVKTNPSGNNGYYRDFAYLESALKVNLDATIPLSFIANNLVLLDTVNFDLSNTNTSVKGIKDGVINIITQNRYPLQAKMTMIIVDENFIMVDTLIKNMMLNGAPLDANCKSQNAIRDKTSVQVDEARMTNIKRGRKALIYASFNTPQNNANCNGQPLQIFSDYKLDVTFTARFNYSAEVKIE